MIAYQIARQLFSYDAESGDLLWATKYSRKIVPGQIAGSVNGHGYCQVKVFGRIYKAHRIAWLISNGSLPDLEIDHIDGNKLNNRLTNLRLATRGENGQNTATKSDNTSGFSGVSWYKKTGSWRADIQVGGKQTYLGSFHDINDAAAAYAKAKSELHTFQPIARAS